MKLGTDRDAEILKGLRDVTDREIRVDANCAWTARQAIRMLPVLQEYGVTVLEQPVAPGDLEGFAEIRRRGSIPIIADESCKTVVDIPPLVGGWTGSTSSWPSAAACARRSAWSPWPGRTTCRSCWAA